MTSPESLGKLSSIKVVGPTLAYSDDLYEAEVDSIVREGKAVVAMVMSIHSREVGGA